MLKILSLFCDFSGVIPYLTKQTKIARVMGKIKYSALVDEARGKLGNTVLSRNKSGSYFRDNFLPANPNTAKQVATRSNFASVARQWGAYTDEQRQSYRMAAAQYPQKDVFGKVVYLSGFQFYCKLANLILSVGEPLPFQFVYPATSGAGKFDLTATENTLSLTLTEWAQGGGDAYGIIVKATAPMSQGRASFSQSELRKIYTQKVNPVQGQVISLTAAYAATFGAMSPGRKIFVTVEVIDIYVGLGLPTMSFEIVVPEE